MGRAFVNELPPLLQQAHLARDLPDRATTALAKVTSARSLGRGAIEIAVGVQNRSTQRARAVSTVGEAVEIDHCAGMAAIRQLKYPAMSIGGL